MEYQSRISRRMHILAHVPVLGLPVLVYNYCRTRHDYRSPDRKKVAEEGLCQAYGNLVISMVSLVLQLR